MANGPLSTAPSVAALPRFARSTALAGVASLGLLFLWAYWPTLGEMARKWSTDPQYSHGYLVPLFAAVLLWLRRPMLTGVSLRPSWWGMPLVALGAVLHVVGAYFYVDAIDGASLFPCLVGLCLCAGGWPALRWAWPAIAFLAFMVPLPYRVEHALAYPLQRLATLASTYVLQTVGFPAVSEGNTILVNEVRLNVVAACSGLSMLMTFFALCTAVAFIVRRRWTDKCVIVLSALPIALLANLIRISSTGVLHELVGEKVANLVFHDLAGWLMMPLALGLLGIELWLLDHLLLQPPAQRPARLNLGQSARPPAGERRAANAFSR